MSDRAPDPEAGHRPDPRRRPGRGSPIAIPAAERDRSRPGDEGSLARRLALAAPAPWIGRVSVCSKGEGAMRW